MTILTRREKQRRSVRAAILDAARELAQKEGWRAVSMRKIASEIDYSPTVIYEYFGSKDELVLAIAREGFQTLNAEVKKVISRSDLPADSLRQIAEAYYQFSVHHQPVYEAMFGLGVVYTIEITMPEIGALYNWLGELIAKVLERPLTQPEAFRLSILLWSHLHGIVTFLYANGGNLEGLTPVELIDSAVSSFITANSK